MVNRDALHCQRPFNIDLRCRQSLYVMTTDPSISGMSDLVGRTVYSYGEGGTPEMLGSVVMP